MTERDLTAEEIVNCDPADEDECVVEAATLRALCRMAARTVEAERKAETLRDSLSAARTWQRDTLPQWAKDQLNSKLGTALLQQEAEHVADLERQLAAVTAERDELRGALTNAREEGPWAWCSGEDNHLESMTDGMVIRISAGQLRALLGRDDVAELKRRLAEAKAKVGHFLHVYHGADGGDTDEAINDAVDALGDIVVHRVPDRCRCGGLYVGGVCTWCERPFDGATEDGHG